MPFPQFGSVFIELSICDKLSQEEAIAYFIGAFDNK